MDSVKVRIDKDYFDLVLNKRINAGNEMTVDADRAAVLVNASVASYADRSETHQAEPEEAPTASDEEIPVKSKRGRKKAVKS